MPVFLLPFIGIDDLLFRVGELSPLLMTFLFYGRICQSANKKPSYYKKLILCQMSYSQYSAAGKIFVVATE